MSTQIAILDYDLTATVQTRRGWGKAKLFNREIVFYYNQYDAVTAAIELGLIEQPDDRDETRVGYEKPAFSATVREVMPWEWRVQYQENAEVLREFGNTEFAEGIVRYLALQAPEVREAIQAEAERIALHECPAGIVGMYAIFDWMWENKPEFMQKFSHKLHTKSKINFKEISDHKKELWYAAEQETLSQL